MLPKGLSEGSSPQGTGTGCGCRRSCTALLKPTHRRGSRTHQQARREAKLSNTPPVSSLFTGSSTCCTYKPEGCALASAARSCLPQKVQWERSKHCLPSRSRLSYHSTPSCLLWDPAPLLPWGSQPQKQAHFPQMPVARCLSLSGLGRPCATVPWGVRTPGSCPCALHPGHHPGSAGPEEESVRQLQVSLASPQLGRITSSRWHLITTGLHLGHVSSM